MTRVVDEVLEKRGFSGLVCCFDAVDKSLVERAWTDPRVGMWEATGGEDMGVALLRALAPTMKRTLLELGGNNAVVVHSDADIDQAVESCLFGTTGTAGQRWGAIAR